MSQAKKHKYHSSYELKREIMKISDEMTGQNTNWLMLYVANLDLNQIGHRPIFL